MMLFMSYILYNYYVNFHLILTKKKKKNSSNVISRSSSKFKSKNKTFQILYIYHILEKKKKVEKNNIHK